MNTKTLVACAALLLASAFAYDTCASSYKAADSRISYEGRVQRTGDAVRFDWSGTIVRINFSGTCLKMNFSDSKCDYFNLWVDKDQDAAHNKVLKFTGSGSLAVVEGLDNGVHSIVLQKRTEGEQGCLTIKGFETDGEILPAEDPFTRHIEFIGDSYTCGYGTEATDRSQPFRAAEENSNLTYAAIIGRYFGAGIRTVCHSGRGVVRNYNDAAPGRTMTLKYSQTFDEFDDHLVWKASEDSFHPDLVVIYLGTNDFSCGKHPTLREWCAGYVELLGKVASNYGGDIPVLCMAPKCDALLDTFIAESIKKSGLNKVRLVTLKRDVHNDTSDLGASWHPNYKGQRKVACSVIPYISTLTGWELPVKAIE